VITYTVDSLKSDATPSVRSVCCLESVPWSQALLKKISKNLSVTTIYNLYRKKRDNKDYHSGMTSMPARLCQARVLFTRFYVNT